MFDMENEEALVRLINNREDNSYVIPLYVHINNQRYNLWELKDIDSFSRSTIKIGFGSSRGLMVHSQFPSECVFEFEMEFTTRKYDYEKDVEIFYYVFESGFLSEEELKDDIHKQIQIYVEQLSECIDKIVQEKRKQRIRDMLIQGMLDHSDDSDEYSI